MDSSSSIRYQASSTIHVSNPFECQQFLWRKISVGNSLVKSTGVGRTLIWHTTHAWLISLSLSLSLSLPHYGMLFSHSCLCFGFCQYIWSLSCYVPTFHLLLWLDGIDSILVLSFSYIMCNYCRRLTSMLMRSW
jgi:hypothetical protein